MTSNDDLRRDIAALRERISAHCAASLRISASLDLETVLREVVESARSLTGARFGAITTIDEAGAPQDFVTSGITEAEHRAMVEWSDGPRLFEHFRDLPGPIRIADVSAYVQELGFPTDRLPWGTFQGTPMRHRGEHVGNFYLVEKEGGGAFTDEDEEILVLFASQAATAIANARTYRAEQRARADLEALIETSPVGVVVFDVRTGHPASLNREARRIVESLCSPGQSAEQLLAIITYRRADGREIALDQFPIAGVLSDAETVRAEEIVLSTADGRSVTTLVNATPIHSSDGTVESVVVAMQDLAPLQELERQRAEFLEMVSHELRAPLSSIKGCAVTLMDASSTLDRAEMRAFSRIIVDQADHMRGLISDLLDAGRIDSGTLSVAPEPTEVAALVDRARNTFLSGGSGHDVLIDLAPDLPRIMTDRRRIVQVAEQPPCQRRAALSRARPHPRRGDPRRGARRDLRPRPGPGHCARAAAAPFPQACHGWGGRPRRRTRACHLQGAGGSPWWTHLARERRRRPGRPLHIHDPRGRGDGRRGDGSRPRPAAPAPAIRRPVAHLGGGRRPAGAPLCSRRAHRGGL